MHLYSFESFLRNKYAALRKHKAIFFMALLAITISSIYLIMAAIQVSVAPPASGNTDAFTIFNFTINNTEGGGDQNITVVTILMPDANVTFNGSNGTSTAFTGRTGTAIMNNTNALIFNWTTIDPGNLPLIDNSTGTSVANRSFWIALNSSIAGDFTLKINVTYSNGSRSQTTKIITFNDNVAPTYTNQLPGPNNFTSSTTPTIFINITDTGSDVNITEINMSISYYNSIGGGPLLEHDVIETLTEVYLGNNKNGYQVKYVWGTVPSKEPPLSGGENISIRVNAVDNSSNANAMAEVIWNITIDTAAPNITVIEPSANVNLTGAADNITVQITDQWNRSINLTDVYAAIKNSSGYYNLQDAGKNRTGDYTNWTRLYQSGSTSFFNATLNSSNFTDGTYTLYINTSDLAGNMKENKSINITIDNTAPGEFALSSPGNITNSSVLTPTLTWLATEETNFLNYTVQVSTASDFSSITQTQSSNAIGTISAAFTALTANTKYYWRVTAWDVAGNNRTNSSYIYITDNVAPTITFVIPSGDVNLTGSADNITITVDENVSVVYAALHNGTGGAAHYYDLNGTQATGDLTTWTALNNSRKGIWYNTTLGSNNFSDGTYTLYINATDWAGNNGTNSDTDITIDNTAPGEFALSTPANDTVSTNSTPTLQWGATLEANFLNYTIQIDDDTDFSADLVKTTSTSTTTSATIVGIVTADGLDANTKYYWRVTAWDAAGNSYTAPVFTYTTDNTKPQINVTWPANNTNQTDYVNITVQVGDASRNSSDVFAALKKLSSGIYYNLAGTQATGDYRTWTNLPQVSTTETFNASLNSSNFTDGSYIIYINASDNASNMNENKSFNITIDNTAPTSSNLVPANGNFTNDNTPTVTIDIADNLIEVDNNSIDVWYSATGGIPASNVTNEVARINLNGLHSIRLSVTLGPFADTTVVSVNVSAKDAVGNAMTKANWSFTVDVTKPEIEIISPTANQTNQTDGDVNITVKITDTNKNYTDMWVALKNSTAYYKLDGAKLTDPTYQAWTRLNLTGAAGSSAFFNASLNANAFTGDGKYIIYVNATDLGGSSTENKSITLSIDNNAPVITLGTPATYANTTMANMSFVWNIIDNVDTTLTCNLTLDSIINATNRDREINNATDVVNKSASVAELGNGTHTWNVTCIDDVKNIGTSVINTFYVETSAFTVTLNTPANYYNSSSAAKVVANWTVNNPTYSNVWCNVSLDGTIINNTGSWITVSNGTNKNWYNFTNLSNGLHEWNVSCRDALFTVNSSTSLFTVDTVAPAVSILNPVNETNTTSTAPTITFNVTDDLSAGNFTCELFFGAGSKGVNTSAMNDSNSDSAANSTLNASDTAGASYVYYVNCTDFSGNTGRSKKMVLTIDTTAPVLAITYPVNNSNRTNGYINVTATVTELNWVVTDVYAALHNGTGGAAHYYDLNGTQATGDYTTWTNLAQLGTTTSFNATALNASNFTDGTYYIYVNTSNAAGTLGTSPARKLVIDKTPPLIENATYINASVGQDITIAVNVSDATSGVNGSTATAGNCTFYFNLTLMASVLYNANTGGCNKTFTIPGTFTSGNYTLGINATDWAGNNGSNTSYTIQVFADTSAPSLSITLPANYTNQSSTSLNVTWTTTDNLDLSLSCNISIFNNTLTGSINSSGNITTTAASGVVNSTMLMGMNSSRYNISVSCWDDALNTNTTVVVGAIIDAVAPAVTITTQNITNLSATATTISFNVTDSYSANFTCELFFGADNKGTNATNVVNSTSAQVHTINASNTGEGLYNYYVNCTNFVGNTGQSAKNIITFDTSVPTVNILTPSASSYNRSSLQINVTVMDAYTNITAVRYRLVGVSPLNTTSWTDMSLVNLTHYNATFTSTTILDGAYNVEILANDTLNNTNMTTKVAITIDNTAPALKSWNYSSISKNLTLLFNETVDPSSISIDLSKISVNYSDGSTILSTITGATVTSSNSSTLSTTINISLLAADYNALDQYASSTIKLTIQANAIRDRAGNNLVKNSTTITNWGFHNITIPNYGSTYVGWKDISLKFTSLQTAASLGGNYNITNVLASISGNYQIFYAYNVTSGSYISYVPGSAAGNSFANFTSDTDTRAYTIYLTSASRIEII